MSEISEISEYAYDENSYYNNNIAILTGEVTSPPSLSHEIYGEKYYITVLAVERLSGKRDFIPVTVSERLFCDFRPSLRDIINVIGQYRSYNNYSGTGNKLILTVFAKEITYLGKCGEAENNGNPNQVFLNGYLCKKPTYRTTPFNREISDILLAVNRSYKKSDYIPCIAWGRNAKYIRGMDVGTNLKVWGRIQSREYQKYISETEIVNKTAYEVSISKLEACFDNS